MIQVTKFTKLAQVTSLAVRAQVHYLVLVEPVAEVVVDDAGVVGDDKVGVLVLAAGLLLQEDVGLAQQVLLQLVLEGLVAGLG